MKQSNLPSEPHLLASWLMNDIARVCRRLIDRQMRSFDLTSAQWYLLNYLYSYDGISQQELAGGPSVPAVERLTQEIRLELQQSKREGDRTKADVPADTTLVEVSHSR
jgi:hypothetical protein